MIAPLISFDERNHYAVGGYEAFATLTVYYKHQALNTCGSHNRRLRYPIFIVLKPLGWREIGGRERVSTANSDEPRDDNDVRGSRRIARRQFREVEVRLGGMLHLGTLCQTVGDLFRTYST